MTLESSAVSSTIPLRKLTNGFEVTFFIFFSASSLKEWNTTFKASSAGVLPNDSNASTMWIPLMLPFLPKLPSPLASLPCRPARDGAER